MILFKALHVINPVIDPVINPVIDPVIDGLIADSSSNNCGSAATLFI